MNTFYKTAIATGVIAATLFLSASPAFADGATVTPTATPTSTPKPETRVECTTGAYGQQTCKTIVVERVASPSGTPAHQVVNSGISENIIIALFAVMILSSVGYSYSKIRA